MVQSSIATAADCADAMLTARRARNFLSAFLFVILLAQLGLFCAVRFTHFFDKQIPPGPPTPPAVVAVAASGITITPATHPSAAVASVSQTVEILQYLVGVTDFLGIVFVLVLAFVLLLMLLVMIVGRLIGVSHVTTAYVLCLLLAGMLFPWQAFLNNANLTAGEFRVPGVLYTWNELSQQAHFATDDWHMALLKWARFVGFPVVALILLVMVQTKSSKGLSMALGDDDTIPLEPHAAEHQP
jgi:hypothetical protein